MNEKLNKFDTKLSRAFTPASPVDSRDLFSGRINQLRQVVDASNRIGQHVVIYGERGVGKTSLGNILSASIVDRKTRDKILTPSITCSSEDSFSSVWRHVFDQIKITSISPGFGDKETISQLSKELPTRPKLDDVKSMLPSLPNSVIIIDEFDRLSKGKQTALFADLIKALADRKIPVTIVLIGIADNINELIQSHESIERCITQIHLPKMSMDELEDIVIKRYGSSGITYDDVVPRQIARLSQGFPHYTHSLGLWAGRYALDEGRTRVIIKDVNEAISKAVEETGASIQDAYQTAIISSRKESLYKEVLLACALVEPDEFGYFAAADVREPYSKIRGKWFDIPAFSKHLSSFCSEERGKILQRKGRRRGYQYRFSNPLMRTYVYLNGFKKQILPTEYSQMT